MGKAEQLLELLDLQGGSFKGASRAELITPGLIFVKQVPQLAHLVFADGAPPSRCQCQLQPSREYR